MFELLTRPNPSTWWACQALRGEMMYPTRTAMPEVQHLPFTYRHYLESHHSALKSYPFLAQRKSSAIERSLKSESTVVWTMRVTLCGIPGMTARECSCGFCGAIFRCDVGTLDGEGANGI